MAELHYGSQGIIHFNTLIGSQYVDSSSITATLRPNPTTLVPSPSAVNLTVVNDDVNEGSYCAYVPNALTAYGAYNYLDLEVSYAIPGDSTPSTLKRRYYLVKPYAHMDEIIHELGFGIDTSDPNYKTASELMAAERWARFKIDAYTGQTYGIETKSVEVIGDGTDVLLLPERLESFSQVLCDDVAITDATFKITPTNYALRINKEPGIDVFETYPYVSDIATPGYFSKGKRYSISGVFGYVHTPRAIVECTLKLVNDFFCQDTVWRDKYVKRMQTGDYTVEISPQAFTGTGNSSVDRVLDSMIASRMVII